MATMLDLEGLSVLNTQTFQIQHGRYIKYVYRPGNLKVGQIFSKVCSLINKYANVQTSQFARIYEKESSCDLSRVSKTLQTTLADSAALQLRSRTVILSSIHQFI